MSSLGWDMKDRRYNRSVYMCVLVAQSCPTLCNPIDCSPPGPSVHGILQARTLEWVAISFSKRNYRKKESEVAQPCPSLCDPMGCSPLGSSIHGIFNTRVLEWGAMSFSYPRAEDARICDTRSPPPFIPDSSIQPPAQQCYLKVSQTELLVFSQTYSSSLTYFSR